VLKSVEDNEIHPETKMDMKHMLNRDIKESKN